MPRLPPDYVIGGRTYSLAHLQPFTMAVKPKAAASPTFRLRVSFGSHVYSKEWDDGYPETHRVEDGRAMRCFCPVRHEQSLYLPSIIQAAASRKAYFSQNKNYLLEHLPGLNGPYAVFFNIERARSRDFDAVLFVVSVYAKPKLPRVLPAVMFTTLVAKTVRGESIFRPKK